VMLAASEFWYPLTVSMQSIRQTHGRSVWL
jgi:hypothetical protein